MNGFNVGRTGKSLAAALAVLAAAVSLTVCGIGAFYLRGFDTAVPRENDRPGTTEKTISPLEKISPAENDECFLEDRDTEIAPPENNLRAALPISRSLQSARYAASAEISPGPGREDNFVYYCQAWKEYASLPYGNETIGSYGCGPANMAMVISTLTSRRVTPKEMAEFAEKSGFFVPGVGTAHGLFTKSALVYNLKLEEFDGNAQSVTRRLKEGKLIICSMGSGYFSRSGHFLTLRGINAEGKILIADSYSEENTGRAFDLEFLLSQLRYTHMWAFGE